jgi:hypothetical protein
MPLESLWWADDMATFSTGDTSKWKWTAMIMQPSFVTSAIGKVRFESLSEGICAQTLHVGPFSEEGPTIERVHEFIRARGKLVGKHHEIYLSDMDKVKWRLIGRRRPTLQVKRSRGKLRSLYGTGRTRF